MPSSLYYRSLLLNAQPASNPFTESTRTPQKPVSRGKKLSTKRSPGRPLKKSPAKSPGKVLSKSPAKASSKSLKNFFSSSMPSEEGIDDSFAIDLPPASQLDHSVLFALPSSMCQKILEGYSGREKLVVPKKEVVEDSGPVTADSGGTSLNIGVATKPVTRHERKWKRSRKDEIAVGDEGIFLSSWKKYISKLCSSSREGPVDDDCQRTADYLSKLARTNLEMTELCLKSFRRCVELQSWMSEWISAFNSILQQVQEKVTEFYGGVLKMEPLCM